MWVPARPVGCWDRDHPCRGGKEHETHDDEKDYLDEDDSEINWGESLEEAVVEIRNCCRSRSSRSIAINSFWVASSCSPGTARLVRVDLVAIRDAPNL